MSPEWFRDEFTFIKPCCVEDTPEAHTVWVKIGGQQFSLDGYQQTKEEAEWMRLTLGKAFASMVDDIIQRLLSSKVTLTSGTATATKKGSAT